MIPGSFLDELKYAVDIEQTISSYVTLKRGGSNLVGLCPFHSEKTPSFTVYPETQSYYCFGCGSGGDAITFLRQIENLEYIEAVRLLAQRAGMSVPEDGTDNRTARLKARVLEINRESARYFHRCLTGPEGAAALGYLTGRGLAVKTIKRFGLGYAPDGWDSLLKYLRSQNFGEDELLAAAVVRKGKNGGVFDLFRNRVIFPIIDLRGGVIGFGGRLMQGSGPKYLNSPDTLIFKKSRNLFALNMAKNAAADSLILGEGYMDVIAMHQAGFENSVATLGTSLTSEQTQLLSRYTKSVVIAYDSDQAGQKAAQRAINLFGQTGMSVRVLELTQAKDPDEYIQKFGAARFKTLLEGGKSAMRFEIDKLRSRYNLQNPEEKVAFLSAFCRLIAGIHNPLQRDVYIGEIARETDMGKDRLLLTVENLIKQRNKAIRKKESHNLAVNAQDNSGLPPRARQNRRFDGEAAEKGLITLLLHRPDYFSPRVREVDAAYFTNQNYAEIFAAMKQLLEEGRPVELVHLSSLLPPPVIAVVSGLLVAGREFQFRPEQAEEYIQAMEKNRKQKSDKEVAAMSAEEYQAYISSLRANKK